jgi:hypothetical protein
LCYNAPVDIKAGGSLRIGLETGQMRESAPVAWQDINGQRIPVGVTFCLLDSPIRNPVVGFSLGQYNPAYLLVIDPTLQWNTFMGSSSNNDWGNAIAVDWSGNVYVAGASYATWGTPVNPYAGGEDVFVAKLDSSGSLQWSTFMGSSSRDISTDIAVDGSGNVYVAGSSDATWGTPVIPYAGGNSDAFAAKLDSSGSLQWNTFMGSSSDDYGNGIAVDGSGNVYVAGYSLSTWGTPVNPYAGDRDAFAAMLDSSGSLQWNTFMGSSSYDIGSDIAVDGCGNVYVAGHSPAWGTPLNANAGGFDAFVAKLFCNGSLHWHTFMGSSSREYGFAIAVDGSGNVYVTGFSGATWGTPENAHAGGEDAFAAMLDSSGSLQWNTFMGSSSDDYGNAIAVDGSGNVYVAGQSNATWGTPENAFAGDPNGFAARLDSSGSLQWNTFMGSSIGGYSYGIAVDGSRNVYVAGVSYGTWGTPVNAHAGGGDAFAAKIVSDSDGGGSGGSGGSGGCFIATAAR